jgi:hypothetical protein
MFDLSAELVPEDELEVVLTTALPISGGQLTRSTECWMASVVARHLVDQLSLAGLKVVRFPEPRLN